jgi:hypothetical protein
LQKDNDLEKFVAAPGEVDTPQARNEAKEYERSTGNAALNVQFLSSGNGLEEILSA